MSTPLMIGVDIGTTSTKAVVFTLDGRPVSHHTVEYPLLQPEPEAAEQDPETIFAAVLEALATSVARCPEAAPAFVCVGFSAAMHSLIAMDAQDRPLTASVTWADNRAATQAARIKASAAGTGLYRRTGTPIHPMSPLAKLCWLRETRPAVFAQAARFVGIKEYVCHRLFGEWLVDHSIASATGLLNLEKLDWDDEALAVAGVRREQLSALVPTTHALPGTQAIPGLADATFVIGANDGVLSNLGVGAIAPGEVAVTIGTSGAMRAVVDQPQTDPNPDGGRTFCYALTERLWVVGGPVNNGGIVLRWIRDALLDGAMPYDELMRIAARVPAGSEGLLFHPFLAGERAPLWNADLRASWFGLGLQHRREHMVRAALEGVMLNLRGLLPAVEARVGPACTIKATGGFARSDLWRQMMADVFDREVVVPESFESSCLGAAVLGLYALGRIDSLDAVNAMVGATHRHRPAADAEVYRRLAPIFDALPRQLEAQYRELAELQRLKR